ncbi:hypothetical protein Asp14428_49790 [Actinoplanes sp. NBRC 14428]|nr:hypothetical protein Asp14428_49790 [Actinoplanes sp. NBRC 14428]
MADRRVRPLVRRPRRETGIRLFEELISLILGGTSRSDQVGLSPVAVAVIESDGAIEQVDSLKSAYPGRRPPA